MISIGIGVPNHRYSGSLGQTIAQAHYDRVTADDGVLPIGVAGLASVINTIAAAYNVSTTAAFNAAVPVFLDPHYTGYKMGVGSGTTLGQAAQKVYAINSSADVTQATAASQPLLLAHSGVNYWWGSDINGNRVNATSTTTAYTSIEFNTLFKCDSRTAGETNTVFSMSNDEIFQLYTNSVSTYYLIFYWRNSSGIQKYAQSSAVLFTDINNKYVRITVENSGADQICKMYTSIDNINFTLLYQQIIASSNGFANASKVPTIGAYNIISGQFYGKVYRATLSNSIGGAPVVDFNPASYSASTSQTQWTSTTGEVWTINTGTATTGYKGVLVDRTIMQGDKIDDALLSDGNFSFNSNASIFIVSRQFVNTLFQPIASYGTSISDYASWYNESADRNAIDYNSTTSKFKLFTGQGVLLTLNTYITTSNVFEMFKNNVTQGSSTSSSIPNVTSSKLNLFKLVGVSSYGNLNINTIICVSSESNSTTRTAMYNIIRVLNNSAF